jgi:hypothetical protein
MRLELILCFLVLLKVGDCVRSLSDPLEDRDKSHRVFVGKTEGRPIPLPQTYTSSNKQTALNHRGFKFAYEKGSYVCDVVTLAFDRYAKLIFNPQLYEINTGHATVRKIKKSKANYNKIYDGDLLERLVVKVNQPCVEYPSLESDESC